MVSEVFKERISELYREQKISATAMAKKAGISPAAMNFYISGERRPDMEALYKICSAFDCSADWLVGLSDVRSPSNDIKYAVNKLGISEKFIRIIQTLNQESRGALFRLLETECFNDTVLLRYMEYEEIKKMIHNLIEDKNKKREDEDAFPEYSPQIGDNGRVALPPNDAALYYAEKVGQTLSRLLSQEVLSLLSEIGYNTEDM